MEAPPDGMSLPSELEFKKSQLESNKIGVWTRKQVNKGRLYGPFKGEKRPCTEVLNDTYSWQIVGPKGRRLFCVDATDPTKGNWMRYVKTAPNRGLHNLHPVQHKKKIYYKVLETLSCGTELLCWYDGATDPELKENDQLPMPVLEKMSLPGNAAHRAPRRVPSPLEMQPLGVSEGLEPPLISPAYPSPQTGYALEDPLRQSQVVNETSTSTEMTGSTAAPSSAPVAIQAPDVSSSGELLENLEGVSDAANAKAEPVASTEVSRKQAKQRAKKQKKKLSKEKKVKMKKGLLKDPLRKPVVPTNKTKVKGERDLRDMVTDLYVIGPECVVVNEEGVEKYRCEICRKLCKYPVGLKIHMRTSHLCVNVQIKGIAKKPWGLGIVLEREREERAALLSAAMVRKEGANDGDQSPAETWASVDRSVVQSALDKLKDVPGKQEGSASLEKEGRDDAPSVQSLSESAAVGVVSFPLMEGKPEELGTASREAPVISSRTTGTGNEQPFLILGQDLKSDDGAARTPTGPKVNVSKLKGKTKKDPFIRKGKNGKDSPARKKGTNGTYRFAREEDQTIIALSELSISESDQLDSSSDASSTPKKNTLPSGLADDKGESNGASPMKHKSANVLPKKFSCPHCRQAFAYQVWLDRHLKTHSKGITGYSCGVCDLKFSSKKDLSLHQTQHGHDGKGEDGSVSREKTGVSCVQEAIAHQFQNSTSEGTDMASGKARANDNLAKLVASLQKIQGESSSSKPALGGHVIGKETGVKRNRKVHGSGTEKKYLCRICVATFANPSNRSRHMRLIHGITRKKVLPGSKGGEVKSGVSSGQSSSESGSGSTLTSTDSQTDDSLSSSNPSPFSLRRFVPILPKKRSSEGELSPQKYIMQSKTSTHTDKNTSTSKDKNSPKPKQKSTSASKMPSPRKARSPRKESSPKKGPSSKKIDVPVLFGYWRSMPRMKIVKNDLKAHVRKQSKRRNVPPFNLLQEFPRTPDIQCPWDGMNKPSPFVPRPNPVPSLESFVSLDEQPTDLSLNMAAKLPPNNTEKSADSSITEQGESGPPQSRVSLPMDLSNGNYFQYKPKSSNSVQTSLHTYGHSSHCTDVQVSGFKSGVNKGSPRNESQKRSISSAQELPSTKVRITSNMSSMVSSKKSSSKCPAPPVNPVEWHFTCNICTCNFPSIRELSTHVVAHAEDYPYKCEFCMHVFTLVDQLQYHKEIRHSVKTMYACSVCKKEFAYLSNLENHQVVTHPGVRCTFEDNLSNVVRPQNFTDPTKAFNLQIQPSKAVTRVSYLREEMNKLKRGILVPEKTRDKPPVNTPTKKGTPEKNLLFNPQRHHPFEQRRRIGYLSMLSDPRNQKQLGAKVGSNVCTKCLQEFKETSAFHVHIMECASVKGEMLKKGLKEPLDGSDSSQPRTSNTVLKQKAKIETSGGRVTKNDTGGRVAKKSSGAVSRRGRICSSRQKPGSVAYDPQKYLRAKTVVRSAFDDIHSCAGCGKKFYFINQLERHMKMCPNREKLVRASKSTVALALRKRPRANTLQHKCTNCEKHFTYLGSLEKHLLMCTRGDAFTAGEEEDTLTEGMSDVEADSQAVVEKKSLPNTILASDNSSSQGDAGRKRRKCSAPQRRTSENVL